MIEPTLQELQESLKPKKTKKLSANDIKISICKICGKQGQVTKKDRVCLFGACAYKRALK